MFNRGKITRRENVPDDRHELYDQYFADPLPASDLTPYHWEPETRRFFRQVLHRDCAVGDTNGIMGYYSWAVITGRLTP